MKYRSEFAKIIKSRQPAILGAACIIAIFIMFYGLYSSYQLAVVDSINTLSTDFVHRVNATAHSAENILQNFAAQIYSLRSITKMRTYQSISNAEMIDGIRVLNDFTASSTVLDSIYVYNGKQDYIYSTMSSGAISDACGTFKDQDAVAMFKNRTTEERMIPIPRTSTVSSHSANRQMISIMVFDIVGGNQPADNALMLNISSSWFSELYFGEDQDTIAFIIDESGDILFASPSTSPETSAHILKRLIDEDALDEDDGSLIFDMEDGEEELCFYARMPGRRWTYIHTIPYAKYLSGISGMESKTYLFFSAIFLLGAIATVILAYRIIFPFRSIQNSLSKHAPNAADSSDPIAQLNELIRQSADSTHIKDELRSMLRAEALHRLLMGYAAPENAPPIADTLSLSPNTPTTALLISSIRLEQMLHVVRPLCPNSEGVTLQGDHTVLLLQPQDDSIIPQLCSKLLSILPGRRILIGPPTSSDRELRCTYERLAEANRLHFLYTNQPIRTIAHDTPLEDYSVACESDVDQIINSLKSGSLDAASNAYDALIAALPGKSHKSVVFALTQLARSVLKLYYEHFPDAQPPYKAARTAFDETLTNLNSIHDLTPLFSKWFAEITDHVRHERRSRQSQIIDEVLQIINEKFREPSMNSQYLADSINMSSPYLSRLFKQAQGVSIADYINQLRIEEAKRLLTQTDVKVMDLGEKLGVENMQYFFVRFKQATGLTPRQYRLQFRPENKES